MDCANSHGYYTSLLREACVAKPNPSSNVAESLSDTLPDGRDFEFIFQEQNLGSPEHPEEDLDSIVEAFVALDDPIEFLDTLVSGNSIGPSTAETSSVPEHGESARALSSAETSSIPDHGNSARAPSPSTRIRSKDQEWSEYYKGIMELQTLLRAVPGRQDTMDAFVKFQRAVLNVGYRMRLQVKRGRMF